jgi:hypothetical protein
MPLPKFQPNEEQRRMVKALAGYGVKQRQIAALLGLASTTTLRKHFAEELRLGTLEAKAQMLGMLFKMAHSGRHPTMTMFWLKTRGGWSETGNRDEVSELDRRHRWVVRVYQPPRGSEHQNELEAARQGVQEAEEWEEFTPT